MNAAGSFRCGALFFCLLSAGCQTAQHGGDPDADAAEGAEAEAALETEESADRQVVDADLVAPEEEIWFSDAGNEVGSDTGPRISMRDDDGKWEVLSGESGERSAALAPWVETAPPFIPGAPPEADFQRVFWEENPRKARWKARDENRYLFFAFLSTELGNASSRFQQDLFASQTFHDLARQRMVLTYLDYPRAFGIQPDEILRERYYDSFKEHLNIHGFPSAVLLDPGGNVVCRFRGYSKRRSIAAMVAELQDAIGPAGGSNGSGAENAAE